MVKFVVNLNWIKTIHSNSIKRFAYLGKYSEAHIDFFCYAKKISEIYKDYIPKTFFDDLIKDWLLARAEHLATYDFDIRRGFPDHCISPELLAYGLKHGQPNSVYQSIKYDHGMNTSEYIDLYYDKDFFKNEKKGILKKMRRYVKDNDLKGIFTKRRVNK